MRKAHRLTVSQFIAFGYLIVILIGTLLLITPLSSSGWKWTNPIKALFTATSATCVTGLVVVDTGTYWSIFGQIIILILIQIGGIGFMAVISLIAIVLKRKINLHERKIIMQSSGSLGIAGVISLLKKIILFTITCELIGAIVLSTQFIPEFGFLRGVYYSIFHSVSAFCNAGFDVLGNFDSLTNYASNEVVNITVMLLVVIGGLGFFVWSDIFNARGKWKKLLLHTKMVIITTLLLIFIPAILFFVFELNHSFASLSLHDKIFASLFQSITCRTAGFNTVEIGQLTDSSILLSTVLMFIGGSPGSTAGGIKTTTFVVLILSIVCASRRKPNIIVGKRQLDHNVTKHASAIAVLYMFFIMTASMLIMAFETNNAAFAFRDVIFEVVSAIGTVGLSAGGTINLGIASQIILIVLMYVGRLGALAIIYIFRERASSDDELLQRPTEKILIG